MNPLEQVNSYLARLEARLRAQSLVRGAALAAASALVATVLLVLLANAAAFSGGVVLAARVLLFLSLAMALTFGLVIPLFKLNRRAAARKAERGFPGFEQRLLTFAELSDSQETDPFLHLLAADTIAAANQAQPNRLVRSGWIAGLASAAAAAVAVLVWLIVAGPGFLGYGSALLWAGEPRAGAHPFYDIEVSPGNQTLRRGSDQMVTAQLLGFQAQQVRLYSRYRSATKWEQVAMRPQQEGPGYEALLTAIPDVVDYYAEAAGVRSKTFTLNVADLAHVKKVRVTYHYPSWTRLAAKTEDPGGDLRAVEGTEAEVAVQTDRPLASGTLVLDDGTKISMHAGEKGWSTATVPIQRDGLYHVAAMDREQAVRISEDYFIEAQKDMPPTLRVTRPGRDSKVNPIEEVAIQVSAEDDFGLEEVSLHYSVNGGAEKTQSLLPSKGVKKADGDTLLSLEDYKLVPGDIVSLYATARDARNTVQTDMYFVQAEPFERHYSQSQQAPGDGDSSGQGDDQNRISERQKEIIAATWNQIRDRSGNRAKAAENAKFLAGVEDKLKGQVKSMADRMKSRELSEENDQFKAFASAMEKAAEAMGDAVNKLKNGSWQQALQPEQQALQNQLRAEAMFREIQVAFGNRSSGRGGAGSRGAGRDLEGLFDLELDTEKNQYETGQQAAMSSGDKAAQSIDEALKKLEELARRQQQLADEQRKQQQSFQQRWQQEMLRREAEQLQRQMEEMARGNPSRGQQQGDQSSQSSESSQSSQSSASASSRGQQTRGNQRIEDTLQRLKQATEEMRRAAAPKDQQSPNDQADAKRAAERLQEARDLLRGLQGEKNSEALSEMSGRAERLAGQQRAMTDRMRQMYGNPAANAPGPPNTQASGAQDPAKAEQLASEHDGMANEVKRLEQDMQKGVREMGSEQRDAAGKLRQALGELESRDLANRMKYNAELMRHGLGPYAVMREEPVTEGLDKLRDQLREAQAALGASKSGDRAELEKALAQVERLRAQVEQLTRERSAQQSRERSGQLSREGKGQPSNDKNGQPSRETSGQLSRDGNRGGNVGSLGPTWGDTARDLNDLGAWVGRNPDLGRDLGGWWRDWRGGDRVYQNNPQLLGERISAALPGLEQLELQLRRKLDDKQSGNARTGISEPLPPGYADAVAEYFRKLSKEK